MKPQGSRKSKVASSGKRPHGRALATRDQQFKKPFKKAASPKEVSTLPKGYERLERYLAHSGIASRREAKKLITDGAILVNNKKITEPGFGVRPGVDEIGVVGHNIADKESVLFYKPRGIETSATSDANTDIRKRYQKFAHLNPVGRLDKDTEGLIILSNDGTLTRILTGENSTVEKEYLVEVREQLQDTALFRMADGIKLDGVMTKPAVTKRKGRNSFTIILTEGRKHQIRRMCDACKLTINKLTRIRIGHLKATGMIAGNAKPLTAKDIQLLKA